MEKIIEGIHIENFRGIKVCDINFDNLNMFIGDNGTNKTSILEAINFAFSPSFLTGRIKSTDFYEGTNDLIKIEVKLANQFKVKLPDGYTTQEVDCDKIKLTIKKRERKSPGKILSEPFSIEHIVKPRQDPSIDQQGNEFWEMKRRSGTLFKFDHRYLSFGVFESDEIPRAFYFNKERDKQLSKGFNTSFSSIIDDLNWRYLKKLSEEPNHELYTSIRNVEKQIVNKTEIENLDFIKKFNTRVRKFNLEPVEFAFLEKSSPFNQSFLSKNYEKINLPIKYLGSGIEMIYSLLFLDTLASLSKETLLIIIDEPELHLHPNLQEKFADYLFELSQDSKCQIFISTHSPIFFKALVSKDNVRALITKKQNSNFEIQEYGQKKSIFPWGPTWGEINYFAYNYPTVEFHNELYGYLQEITEKMKFGKLDEYLNSQFNIPKDKKWIAEKDGQPQDEIDVTLMTFIRHKIHHPENRTMANSNYTIEELKESIDKMLNVISGNSAANSN